MRLISSLVRTIKQSPVPIPPPPPVTPKTAKQDAQEIKEWEQQGKPVPPPYAYKRRVIRDLAKKKNIKVLIETGTFLGETPIQLNKDFSKIHTIELEPRLYAQAKTHLAPLANVHVWKGNSAQVLKKILPTIDQPILFWLDAHFSGGFTARGLFSDTPIEQELKTIISRNKADVILIDDAREFGTKPNYPSIETLKSLVTEKRTLKDFSVENDIIALHLD